MYAVKGSTLLSKWVGESDKLVTALFSLGRKLAPSVIFIGDIDYNYCHPDMPIISYYFVVFNSLTGIC